MRSEWMILKGPPPLKKATIREESLNNALIDELVRRDLNGKTKVYITCLM